MIFVGSVGLYDSSVFKFFEILFFLPFKNQIETINLKVTFEILKIEFVWYSFLQSKNIPLEYSKIYDFK